VKSTLLSWDEREGEGNLAPTVNSFLKVSPYASRSRSAHELGGMAPLDLPH